MTPTVICKHCGEAIEPIGKRFDLWTHADKEQQKCIVARPVGGTLQKRPEKYSREDFSADAIAWRFSCGSWDNRDVDFIIKKLRELEREH